MMERWLAAVALTFPSPPVVAFWSYTVANPDVMDREDLFRLFDLVAFRLGLIAGPTAVVAAFILYSLGWNGGWPLTVPLVAGAVAFVVNGLAFLCLIAPGC